MAATSTPKMTPADATANVALVREIEQLEPLYDRWRDWAVERESAFVTPEWFRLWMRHYAEQDQPLVAVVRDGRGALAGLLPLVRARSGRSRTVRFAGSSLGDIFEPVAPAGCEADVARAVGRALRSAPGGRPVLVLENVEAEASWWRELSRAAGYGGRPPVGRPASLPRVALEGRDFQSYLAARSRNLRSQVGRKRRALERDHDVQFRWTADEAEVAADVRTLFELHDRRWDARSGDSSLSSPRARAFLADFSMAAFERGWLRLCVLEAEGAPVAAWLGWRIGGRFAYYQAGFDPAWADRSVGFVLLSETLRRAAVEGSREYDMLLGEEAFKLRFADSARDVTTAVVAPRLRPARVLAATEAQLRDAAHRLPEALRERARRRGRGVLERLPMTRRP